MRDAKSKFTTASSLFNIPHKKCLVIGDSKDKDIAGAKQLGMQYFLVDRNNSISLSKVIPYIAVKE